MTLCTPVTVVDQQPQVHHDAFHAPLFPATWPLITQSETAGPLPAVMTMLQPTGKQEA